MMVASPWCLGCPSWLWVGSDVKGHHQVCRSCRLTVAVCCGRLTKGLDDNTRKSQRMVARMLGLKTAEVRTGRGGMTA
jgi:hypothetical protein